MCNISKVYCNVCTIWENGDCPKWADAVEAADEELEEVQG